MSTVAHHSSFKFIKSQKIPSLKIEVAEYCHKVTGAHHFHLAADNSENVFTVAFRTIPEDSTGVPHILEHTVLAGSKNYPIHDPFTKMNRRSLNSFMNAGTMPDHTSYPFATPNKKDFNNLLKVYLDAVFFPNLEEPDFQQEGHRLEFVEEGNTNSELQFSGVVFNEMKGMMANISFRLFDLMKENIFPTTTYKHNYGGTPSAIPNLTYQQFCDFHKTHYHPSNATFFTYGDIPAVEHQQNFEELVLQNFSTAKTQITIAKEQRFTTPKIVEADYPLDEKDISNKTYISISWLLGETADINQQMDAEMLEAALTYDSSSPLRQALETSDLGKAISPLTGLDSDFQEMCFSCGIEGSEPDKAQEVEDLIITTLKKVAEEGIPYERLKDLLHQIELHEREMESGGPLGLGMIMHGVGAATYNADVIEHLNVSPTLERLHKKIKEADYIPNLINELLLNNNHRVRLTVKPNQKFNEEANAAEKARLAELKATMSEEELQAIVTLNCQLKKRQEAIENEDILPTVTIADIPQKLKIAQGKKSVKKSLKTTSFAKGTNGLVYQTIIMDLPEFSPVQLVALPCYTSFATQLGVGEKSYSKTLQWQTKVSGGISMSAQLSTYYGNPDEISGHITLGAKALAEDITDLTELMTETLDKLRFDEHERIRELVAQRNARMQMQVTHDGHLYAIQAAKAALNPVANIHYNVNGLKAIKAFKELDKAIDNNGITSFIKDLEDIHNLIKTTSKQLLLVGEEQNIAKMETALSENLAENLGHKSEFVTSRKLSTKQTMWITDGDVNFCAKAYPAVDTSHADAPALNILAPFLRHGFIHRALREQGGAYGGFATFDKAAGVFAFASYRDPRLVGTLEDFDKSIEWMLNTKHEEKQLHEAIFSIIQQLDSPETPAVSAKTSFYAELNGRTAEIRQAYRKAILDVTLEDLKRVTETYLIPKKAATAVITNNLTLKKVGDLDMEVIRL